VTILPYQFMRVRDKIELKWGTESLRHVVTKEQAEAPASNTIKIFVSRTVIENAGSSNKLPVMFKPVDEANNLPDENGPWSTTSYVDVDLDDSKLGEPYVEQADYITSEIDLKALNGQNVKVEVQTNRQNYKPGDLIKLRWAGETVDGTPVLQTFEIPVDAPGRTYEAFVSYENVKAIPFGKATVSYEVQTDKGLLYSKKTFVRVVGPLNTLLAPSIDKANGNYLPPDLSIATATIPYYPGRNANDLVILYIIGARSGGVIELYEDARLVGDLPAGLPILRDIQGIDLRRFDGLRIKIQYEVHTASVRTSDVLELTVGEPEKDLPAPTLEGTTPENVFDPVNREVIYQIPLILTLHKDSGTWYFQGHNQAASTQGTFELTPGSAARIIRIPLARHYVDLNQGHTVRLFYNLTRAGREIYSEYREVRIGTPLPTLQKPSVVEAPNGILDPNRYQDGFTVRVNTSTFEVNDAIELSVHGRPEDGSTIPERKTVNGQPYVDFDIPAAITGANLKTVVNISYAVIRLGQETPSISLELSVGALLQQNMPRPSIEADVEGERLTISSIKDNTKVLSDKWPFQRSGLPIWLSYLESRTDGTTRSRDQFVGATHDQGAGLSYTTEVQWLRECRADSKLAIVLKVGLFKGATVSDAVECRARLYTVRAGLDALSTFTDFNWDQWRLVNDGYRAQISLLAGEHYVETIRAVNGYHFMILEKTFQDIQIGERYEFSFNYQSTSRVALYLTQNGVVVQPPIYLPIGTGWQSAKVVFNAGTSQTASPMTIYFHLGASLSVTKADNLRLRLLPRT
jgi:hypothetical protein